jgi:hypothetical protein
MMHELSLHIMRTLSKGNQTRAQVHAGLKPPNMVRHVV